MYYQMSFVLRRNRMRTCTYVLAVIFGIGCFGVAISGDRTERDEELQTLLTRAIDFFELNRFAEAQAVLNAIIAKDPSNEECWKMRKHVSETALRKMRREALEARALGTGPELILSRADLFEREALLSPDNIKAVVADAIANPHGKGEALATLSRIGVDAVPDLVRYLRQNSTELQRVNATWILQNLGPIAVPALIPVLSSNDNEMRQTVCDILGAIRPADPRAIPPLKAVYENSKTSRSLKIFAARALESITGTKAESLPAASDYLLAKANRYYMNDRTTQNEMADREGAIWVWDFEADGGKGAVKKVTVPVVISSLILAEEIAFSALEDAKDPKPFEILIASIYLHAKSEMEALKEWVEFRLYDHPNSEQLIKNVEIWNKRLERNERIAASFGAEVLLGVLEKAMLDGKIDVAIKSISGLEGFSKVDGWALVDKESGGNVLVSALSYPDEMVRIAAANALVRLGSPFASDAKIQKALVEGMKFKKPYSVLIVSNNPENWKQWAEALENKDLFVMVVGSGREALFAATQFPQKDAILIDNDVNEFEMLDSRISLQPNLTESTLPLTIITSKSRAADIQRALTQPKYKVIVVREANSANPQALYEELLGYAKVVGAERPVVLVQAETRAERAALRQQLLLEADKRMRPERFGLFAALETQERALSNMYSVRGDFAPIFVDEDISNFDAMETLTQLRKDKRAYETPVAVMIRKNLEESASKDFAEFLSPENVRLIYADADVETLFNHVMDMKDKNPASSKNYARILSDNFAVQSADAFAMIPGAVTLSNDDAEKIAETVADESRKLNVRIACALALGKSGSSSVAKHLAAAYNETPKDLVELCAAIMTALGRCDLQNEYNDYKIEALLTNNKNDPENLIQKAAAYALALSKTNIKDRKEITNKTRVNNLLLVSENKMSDNQLETDEIEENDSVEAEEEEW